MKRLFTNGRLWQLMTLCGIVLATSCRKDDPVPPLVTENQRVNKWILRNMERDYYWNDDIPADPDMNQDPLDFFESILSEEDRFSWIQESGQELSDNLSGKFESFGYEMKLFFRYPDARGDDNKDDLIAAVVIYTYEGSDAAGKGLQRGMWIGKVNGQDLKESNYNSLLFDTDRPQELSVGQLDADGDFTEGQSITVTAGEVQENPVYYHNVYPIDGKKIGYVVYNSFIPGPAGDTSDIYDQALEDIFADFKSQGVNELILDLRYNLGGYVGSAFKLAGYLMKGYQDNNIFAMYEDNTDNITPLPVSTFYEEGESPPNLGTLDRLYVLVSSNTASASEMIINGLKPFMNVILVGDDHTVGKNVASITIVDERNVPKDERIPYGLQPIVYKIYNAQMESDFDMGFQPDIALAGENFAPFGDLNENFLSAALNDITGGTAVATESLRRAPARQRRKIGSSLVHKPGAGEMYVEPLRSSEN